MIEPKSGVPKLRFREFVFFHEEAIYPEFAVFYRREL